MECLLLHACPVRSGERLGACSLCRLCRSLGRLLVWGVLPFFPVVSSVCRCSVSSWRKRRSVRDGSHKTTASWSASQLRRLLGRHKTVLSVGHDQTLSHTRPRKTQPDSSESRDSEEHILAHPLHRITAKLCAIPCGSNDSVSLQPQLFFNLQGCAAANL